MRVTVSRDGFSDDGTPLEGTPVEHRNVVWWPAVPSSPSSRERPGIYTAATTERVMLFRRGGDVRRSDTVTSPDGKQWHVIGEPFLWESPLTGARPGLMVTVEGVK